MKNEILNWLLSEDDWISYRTRLDLLGHLPEAENAKERKKILSSLPFREIFSDLKTWPGASLKRHNDSKLLIHKLAFLAEAGIKHTDPPMPSIIKKMQSTRLHDGLYPVVANIPSVFGGTGKDELLWMLCDAPIIIYALAKMGMNEDEQIISAAEYLVSLQDENGWRCRADSRLLKFRGPGRRSDPCPYANLLMLKLISQFDKSEFGNAAVRGLDVILNLWKDQAIRKEKMFGIGTDFRKPKAPLIWFDIMHVLDVLSNYKQIYEHESFKQMLIELENMLDENGRLTPRSMYMPWKKWEFSNKKQPSRWLTFLAYRIFKRVEKK